MLRISLVICMSLAASLTLHGMEKAEQDYRNAVSLRERSESEPNAQCKEALRTSAMVLYRKAAQKGGYVTYDQIRYTLLNELICRCIMP